MRMALACSVLGLAAFLPSVWAANGAKIVIEPRADRDAPVYKCGETATFTINVTEDGKPVTDGKVAVILSLDGGRTIAEKTVALGPKPATVAGTLEEPGFLLCAASLHVNDVRVNDTVPIGYNSAAFEPERIRTMATVPDDFDAFWAEGRARVDAIPMDLQLTPVPKFTDDTQETFKISMANIDNTRIYGYLSVPKGRKPPYPAFVSVPGAGVGAPSYAITEQATAGGLALFMGVHTHDLGLSDEEYRALNEGPLRGYQRQGVPDRERYFFRRAILGIDRAVRYLMSRPDWDGKRLVYYGSSQGGGMGLILAGLNPEFTAVAVNVPAMCDRSAYRADRGGSRFVLDAPKEEREQYAKMVEYFDAVNFARKIRCPVIMSVGFMDRSCPPSSVYAAYNIIQAPKRMFHGPRTGHAMPPSFREFFDPWMNAQLGRSDPIPPTAD